MQRFLALSSLLAFALSAKLDPMVQIQLQIADTVDINIVLRSVEDIYTSNSLMSLDMETRVTTMIDTAKASSTFVQKPFLKVLEEFKIPSADIKSFWISNEIFVRNVNISCLESLLAITGDHLIREPIKVSLIHPVDISNGTEISAQESLQWGVKSVRADVAWEKTRGKGAVVAIIDTGVYQGHDALSSNYAGAWYDPIYGDLHPSDAHGHGTHALGSAVGTENGIGVAPGAKWIACRGLDNKGIGTAENLLACAQWILETSSQNRPHVVINSWAGGSGQTWFNGAISAWRAAGIIPVFAIGNSGPNCGSANSPGDQPGVISVGATQSDDSIAFTSSRGPGPSNQNKPEVSAPGVSIVSAGFSAPNSYSMMSGTSMATPHVAGAVALIVSHVPGIGFDAVVSRLQSTAFHPTLQNSDKMCGNSEWPNMAFGHGRIDAAAALI